MKFHPASLILIHLRLSVLFAVLALSTRAEGLYQIHELSEKDLCKTYTTVMRDACRYADRFWTNSPSDPRIGWWGSGRSDQMNEGIRAISGMVLACGTLLKYSAALPDAERKEYSRKAMAAIRYAVASHRSGTANCTDGKPWGGSWQSAYWTATLGFGAWLIWDDLDADLRKGIERVVCSEADRFLIGNPPGGTFNDTKAEENGWNLVCISLAANMFPNHPRAPKWNEKAIQYMINTLSTAQDRYDSQVVDGRPVSAWFAAENLHPDFTLENHGIFHPAYIACSSYFLTEAAMQFAYAHRPIPQAANHHLIDTWKMFQEIILPWGEAAYPQGMDWELHGLPFLNLFASLASYHKDPLAARMENMSLQYIRAWQVMCNGDLTVPGSRLGFTRHACCIDQISYGFLAHKIFGRSAKPVTAREAALMAEGVHQHESVGLITHRTENKLFSFSWTNRVMGMLIPIGRGHEANPEFTAPILDGFIGSFELNPRGDPTMKVVESRWVAKPDGFESTGILFRNGGRLKQIVRVTSLGNSTVVYQDRVTAVSDINVAGERGVPIGIENDKLTAGKRVLFCENGQTLFDWQHPQKLLPFSGTWANVDGRLGVVMATGAGMAYRQATGYDHIALYTDVLYNSFSDVPKHFHAGEEVAHRVAVYYVEVTPKMTASLARVCRIEDQAYPQVLRLKLPEKDKVITLPLL